ncbi:MAG: STAS domain-containing protein [Bacteroidales bacterium]|nr:STAS domain-containing protein [Bacteroidales bacterium]
MKTIDKHLLSYNKTGQSIIVSFQSTNRLSIINSSKIEDELLQLIISGETSILLDFSAIKFIDSSSFRALLSVHIDAKLNEVEFVILNPNNEVVELINLVDLDNIFNIRYTSDSNYKEFKNAS